MPNVEVSVAREPQAAMTDAKEFAVSPGSRGPELSGCKPGPCIQPPGPPVCQPCEKCNLCGPQPNDRP